jgi:hypothetical protein
MASLIRYIRADETFPKERDGRGTVREELHRLTRCATQDNRSRISLDGLASSVSSRASSSYAPCLRSLCKTREVIPRDQK